LERNSATASPFGSSTSNPNDSKRPLTTQMKLIILTVQELSWLLDGFDLWRNRPHQVLTLRFVA